MPKKVVLLDDSRTVVATVELLLNDLVSNGTITYEGYSDPVAFRDMAIASEIEYDLFICDINMPVINGLDLVEELKKYPKFKQKPVLILTTENSIELKKRGKSIGVTGWMVKPIHDEKLISVTKMLLGV